MFRRVTPVVAFVILTTALTVGLPGWAPSASAKSLQCDPWAKDAVFVDPGARENGDGSYDAPFNNLADALALLREDPSLAALCLPSDVVDLLAELTDSSYDDYLRNPPKLPSRLLLDSYLARELGEQTTFWARVTTFMSGSDQGTHWLPEVNDEVVVTFVAADLGDHYTLPVPGGKDDFYDVDPKSVIEAFDDLDPRDFRPYPWGRLCIPVYVTLDWEQGLTPVTFHCIDL